MTSPSTPSKSLLLTALAIGWAIASTSSAGTVTSRSNRPGSELLHDYLHKEAEEFYKRWASDFETAVKSRQGALARQDRLHKAYRSILGPLPERTPLGAVVTGSIACDGYRIEKVYYESRPRHHVTANLYVPTEGEGPWPGVLVLCGHSLNGKAFDDYQRVSIMLAKGGLVALVVDPICQGERYQFLDANDRPVFMGKPGGNIAHTPAGLGALLVGGSTAAYEYWDNVRSIDYLLSRPDVDSSKKVGCLGTSGGGTQTTFLMGLEDRIGPAAPSCFPTHRQALEQGFSDLCQHHAREGELGIQHCDHFAMRAPQPSILLAAIQDVDFPIHRSRKTGQFAQRFYAALGHPDRMEFFESDTGHGLTKPHREKAVQWMRRWLLDDPRPVVEGTLALQKEADLLVTKTGQVIREWEDERTCPEITLARARELATARRQFWKENSKPKFIAEIKRLIGLSDDLGTISAEAIGTIQRSGYAIEKLVIRHQRGIPIPALLFVPDEKAGKLPATLYVDGRGKMADAEPDGSVLEMVARGRIVLSIDARGFGETGATGDWGHEYQAAMLAMHIGRPLLGQQVEDVLAAMDVLAKREDVDSTAIDLVGIERGGPVVLHAGAIDPRFAKVTVRSSITSWIDDMLAGDKPLMDMTCLVPFALTRYDLPDLVAVIALRNGSEIHKRLPRFHGNSPK